MGSRIRREGSIVLFVLVVVGRFSVTMEITVLSCNITWVFAPANNPESVEQRVDTLCVYLSAAQLKRHAQVVLIQGMKNIGTPTDVRGYLGAMIVRKKIQAALGRHWSADRNDVFFDGSWYHHLMLWDTTVLNIIGHGLHESNLTNYMAVSSDCVPAKARLLRRTPALRIINFQRLFSMTLEKEFPWDPTGEILHSYAIAMGGDCMLHGDTHLRNLKLFIENPEPECDLRAVGATFIYDIRS